MHRIDLGWTSVEEDFAERETDVEDMLGRYGWILFSEDARPDKSARYELKSPWYLSEIEDALRCGLMISEQVIIEVPSPHRWQSPANMSDFLTTSTYFDNHVECECSFFDFQALCHLEETFGDSIQGKELLLLPSFQPSWDEFEEVEIEPGVTGWIGQQASPHEVEALLKPLQYGWQRLARCSELLFQEELPGDNTTVAGTDPGLPLIVGGSVKDFIRLRRDETESFNRWLDYVDSVRSSKTVTHREVRQAISQGLRELNDRMQLLKRRSLFDRSGMALSTASVGVAMATGGTIGIVAGALGLAGVAAAALKSVIEYRAEVSGIQNHHTYFLWNALRAHEWRKQ